MMSIVEHVSDLNLDDRMHSNTGMCCGNQAFQTPLSKREEHSFSLSAQLMKGLRCGADPMAIGDSAHCGSNHTLQTPAALYNHHRRQPSNSYLVMNAPRLPASPDMSVDDGPTRSPTAELSSDSTPSTEWDPPLPAIPPALFAPNLAPTSELPMPVPQPPLAMMPSSMPPPMPTFSPATTDRKVAVEPIKMRTGSSQPYFYNP